MASITELVWRAFRGFLEGPGTLIFPQHTREAIFQLSCDLRTNVPKNRKWAFQHGQALKPQSLPGWIAVSSFTFAALSVLSFASSALLLISLGVAGFVTTVASIISVVVGFWTLVISACLFGSTFFLAAISAGFAAGYVTLTTIVNVAKFGHNVVQRALQHQGVSSKQKGLARGKPFADESIQMQPTPKSPTSSSDSTSTSTSTAFKQPAAEDSSLLDQPHSPSVPANGRGSHPPVPANDSTSEDSTVLEAAKPKLNGSGSGLPSSGEGKYKKGKASFAEIQENLESFSPRSVTSKSQGKPANGEYQNSTDSDLSTSAVYEGKLEGTPASKRSKLDKVNVAGHVTGNSDVSSHPVPTDLSPGRAESQQYFADLQKAAKGLSEEETKPEGGPSVQGKFAEAIHPKMLQVGNGHQILGSSLS